METDHQSTNDQFIMISPSSATCQCPSVPAVSAHPCHLPVPHISAHPSCLSVPPISASQCRL
ncbi:unnamed protein product [Staurois parvus]|uniref:Uncharacterized protein n=1 Tax=Staurois parvus TaxID=386267 RepID=A0ABN9CT04_9NEOB|nr:unnamed protein product [Staurois parvus]